MEIMQSTDVNFQALAENITSDFFTNSVPLSDGVVKTAKDNGFTPEEVKRLVEKTNTAASIHLLKTAEDKKGTFTLANVDLVLQQTHPVHNDEPVEKTASVRAYTGLPFTRSEKVDHDPFLAYAPKQEKVAEEAAPNCKDELRSMFSIRKSIDEVSMSKLAMERAVQDGIDYLASEFGKWRGPDFGKFASDSLAVYGEMCMPVLEGLGKYLNASTDNLKKTAGLVDDTTECMLVMGKVCDGLKQLVKAAEQLDELRAAHDFYWESAKKAAV